MTTDKVPYDEKGDKLEEKNFKNWSKLYIFRKTGLSNNMANEGLVQVLVSLSLRRPSSLDELGPTKWGSSLEFSSAE